MNELKPCAPLSLKHVLAQEVVKGLQAVSESLVRYNAMRMLRGNESSLFISLCHAFIEVTLASYGKALHTYGSSKRRKEVYIFLLSQVSDINWPSHLRLHILIALPVLDDAIPMEER